MKTTRKTNWRDSGAQTTAALLDDLISKRLGSCALTVLALSACSSVGAPETPWPATVLTTLRSPAPVDGRARFRTIFCKLVAEDPLLNDKKCDQWLQRLPDEPADAASLPRTRPAGAPRIEILFVPGVFGECFDHIVSVFADAETHMERLGYVVSRVPVHGRASSEVNARIIAEAVNARHERAPETRLVLVSYSKGTADALVALSTYSKMERQVAALVSVAGAVNGSPLADSLAGAYTTTFGQLVSDRCPLIDRGELRSLRRSERINWLSRNALPQQVAYYSIVALPSPARVSGALALWHSRLSRIDTRNDGQLLAQDAVIPGSMLLGYANADHWAVALPIDLKSPLLARTFASPNRYPRSQLVEAALRVVEADAHACADSNRMNSLPVQQVAARPCPVNN